MISRVDIVQEVRSWIGTRYQHQGRVKGVGVDCIGLVGGVAAAVGVPNAAEWFADRAMHNYARTPDRVMLTRACDKFFDPVRLTDAREGDVLLFALQEQPRHFAILVDGYRQRIVHAYALLAARRVVEQGLPIARATTLGAYRFKGVGA